MNDDNKTHFRKAFHSPYLSAADIVDPVTLTIKCVRLEPDKTKKTKDHFNTAYFQEREIRPGEPLKPMILNATNSKMLATLTGHKFIDDWQNFPVTVYVDPHVTFGRDKVEGLRICKAESNSNTDKEQLEGDVKKLLNTARATDAMDETTRFPPRGTWSRSRSGTGRGNRDGGSSGSLIG